jgi:hypothetical protein
MCDWPQISNDAVFKNKLSHTYRSKNNAGTKTPIQWKGRMKYGTWNVRNQYR